MGTDEPSLTQGGFDGDNNIADLFVATLEQAGVKRIFGIVGDSLNGLTEALRKRGTAKV